MAVAPAQDDGHGVVGGMLLPSHHLVCRTSASGHSSTFSTELTALGPDSGELLLKVDDNELIEESKIVAGVPSVPDCQEDEGAELADVSVVEEPQSLVHIVHHLQHSVRTRWTTDVTDPAVGVDVESLNVMSKFLSRLQSPELDVSTAGPVSVGVGVANVGQSRHHTHSLRHQPQAEILGQDQLAPDGEQEEPGQQVGLSEVVCGRPELRQEERPDDVGGEIAETDAESLEAEVDGGGGEAGLVLGRHELAVLGQAKLGPWGTWSGQVTVIRTFSTNLRSILR